MSRSQFYTPGSPPISPGGGDAGDAPAGGFDSIRLEQVGFVGGLRSHILPEEIIRLEKLGMQLTLAEALKSAISPAIEGLAVRNFKVDEDFEDGNDNAITSREWRQPWSGFYTNGSGSFQIYQTNKDTDYDKKVIGIWGLRYTNTGPGRLGSVTRTATITFKDSAGNTYDTWDVHGLDIQNELYSFTPIIFSNTRQLKIFFDVKSDSSGFHDNIQMLGCIAERRGDNVNGLQHVVMNI